MQRCGKVSQLRTSLRTLQMKIQGDRMHLIPLTLMRLQWRLHLNMSASCQMHRA